MVEDRIVPTIEIFEESDRRDMDFAQSAYITRKFVKAFPEIEIGRCVDESLLT